MNKKTYRFLSPPVLYLPLLVLSLSGAAYAQSLEEKAFEVAALSDRSDRGFGNSQVSFEMILRNAAGDESTRKVEIRTLEVPDEDVGEKGLIIFYSPPDIEGTALLSHAKILDPDDQWLYLPALKRVKRISSVNKSGPFVGSEFSFEDITGQELNKYDYRYLREEPCDEELVCDVIERVPLYEYSGYTKQVTWFDNKIHQIRKVDFYDRKGDHLKTLTYRDYKQYKGKYWRPQKMLMVNHLTGKSTDLMFSEYSFDVGLSDKDFVKGALKRLR